MSWSPLEDPTDGIKAEGEFWLPARPERRIRGILRCSGRRGSWIVLEGSLELEDRDDYPEYERVDGQADDRPVSLFECAQLSMPTLSKSQQIIGAQHAILSKTHESLGNNSFSHATVRVDALNEWLGFSPIRADPPHEVAVGQVAVRAEFVQPAQPEAHLSDGTRVRIAIGGDVKKGRYEATVYQSAHLEITPPTAATAQQQYETASRFKDFMTFAIEYPVQVQESQLVDATGRNYDWWAPWNTHGGASDEAASWTHMPLIVREAADYWPQLVQSWFANWDRLADAVHTTIGLTYAPPTYWDTRLVLAAGAAEAYHRRYVGTTRWSRPEFRRRRKIVLDAIPEAERDWVKDATAFAYEPTLRERLMELRERSMPTLPMLFDRYPGWPERTSRMRNDYTHRGNTKAPVHSVDDIYEAVEVTLRVVRTCILLDLGMPSAELALRLLSHAPYLRLIRRK